MSEVEETLKRINSHKGVVGIVIANHEGAPIRSTLETAVAEQMSSQLLGLAAKARSAVRNLDPQNDLTFLRIRSKKHEILVAPEKVRFALHMRVAMSSSRGSSSRNRRRNGSLAFAVAARRAALAALCAPYLLPHASCVLALSYARRSLRSLLCRTRMRSSDKLRKGESERRRTFGVAAL